MKLPILILTGILVTGCSSSGFSTANHNGLMYYFPENCSQYRYSNWEPNILHCFHDGRLTGQTIYPASQDQIENHRYQQAQTQKAWNDLNSSLQETTNNIRNNSPKTTYTNCNGVYGGVNCTSTTY